MSIETDNASIDAAYRFLKELGDGQEPYAGLVAPCSRVLEKYRARVMLEILLPLENLLASIADRSSGVKDARRQQMINEEYTRLASALRDAKSFRQTT